MTEKPQDNTADYWHRFFAIECNNLSWDLTAQELNPEQSQKLLDSAHAAAWHWRHAGNELNHMRATMLLAEVHCIAGSPELALTYATNMHRYFTDDTSVTESGDKVVIDAWEKTLVFGILAHAELLTGNRAKYLEHLAQAQILFKSIESKEDKDIVEITLKHIPKP